MTSASAVRKPCLVCGEVSDENRCAQHGAKANAPTKGERGYDWPWERLSKRARRLQPFCSDCGAVENLQADHSPAAWRRKAQGLSIRLQDIDVVCGPCNLDRGAARGPDPRGETPVEVDSEPPGKANLQNENDSQPRVGP